MTKRLAIVQSSYIPWKGYFDIIRAVDEFVFLDDAQFTRRDWRNRNKIKTAHGTAWLTIPVKSKGKFEQPIDETEVADAWAGKHWASLQSNYARTPYFRAIGPEIRALYDAADTLTMLSRVNELFIRGICKILGIETRLSWSRDYGSSGAKTERLLGICREAGATCYLSGPSARSYMELDAFATSGIDVVFADYAGYPEYRQEGGAFEHGVTVLDLLFNMGPDATACMKPLLA